MEADQLSTRQVRRRSLLMLNGRRLDWILRGCLHHLCLKRYSRADIPECCKAVNRSPSILSRLWGASLLRANYILYGRAPTAQTTPTCCNPQSAILE